MISVCLKEKKVKSLGCVRLFATPWTVAYQSPPSMDFPGKNTGVGCQCVCLVLPKKKRKKKTCLLERLSHCEFPPAMNGSSFYSISSPTFDVVRVLNLRLSNKCVLGYYCLNLCFSNDIWCEASLICLFSTCVSSLMRYLLKSLTSQPKNCVFLLLSFMFFVYFG